MTLRDLLKRLRGTRPCVVCVGAIAVLETMRQQLAAANAEIAELKAREDAAKAAATRLVVLNKIERAAGCNGDEAHGTVLAWQASHADLGESEMHLAEMLQQNATLRRQLASVALQSMSVVDWMKTPITDPEPQKPGSN